MPGTYSDIQNYVARHHRVTVKTCWIADVKEREGLGPTPAPNRKEPQRVNPCPHDMVPLIQEALHHFDQI